MLDVQRGHLPPGNNATPATLFPKAPNGSCSFACSGRTIPIRIPITTRPARGQFVKLTSPRTEQWSGARSSSLRGRQGTVISMSLYHLLRATRCAHLHACASSRRARSQCVYMQKVVGAKRPGARLGARSSSGNVYEVDGTVHFGTRQRARSCAGLRARV